MISEKDKKTIVEIARKYRVSRILLFGSSLQKGRKANDIDLAVEGVAADDFYKFYGELIFSLSKPVDVVDISRDCKFTRMIAREGTVLYG